MGALLAKSNIELVYGGGNEGLMEPLRPHTKKPVIKQKG